MLKRDQFARSLLIPLGQSTIGPAEFLFGGALSGGFGGGSPNARSSQARPTRQIAWQPAPIGRLCKGGINDLGREVHTVTYRATLAEFDRDGRTARKVSPTRPSGVSPGQRPELRLVHKGHAQSVRWRTMQRVREPRLAKTAGTIRRNSLHGGATHPAAVFAHAQTADPMGVYGRLCVHGAQPPTVTTPGLDATCALPGGRKGFPRCLIFKE